MSCSRGACGRAGGWAYGYDGVVRDELDGEGLHVIHRLDREVRERQAVLFGERRGGAVDVLALDVDHDHVDVVAERGVLGLHVVGGLAAAGSPGGVEINHGWLACGGVRHAG